MPSAPVPQRAQVSNTSKIKATLVEASTTKLLVSVRNVLEAELALKSGVHWIDLKEPSQGPLGAPSLETAQRVASALADHPLRSAALGELRQVDEDFVLSLANLFPTLKIALAGLASDDQWPIRLNQLARAVDGCGATLVPVIYADWRNCNAPPPTQVVQYAQTHAPQFVLVDTATKRGNHLLHCLEFDELEQLVNQLHEAGSRVVLAGSIDTTILDQLTTLPIEAIGVRGAVCDGDRSQNLSPEKIRIWSEHFQTM